MGWKAVCKLLQKRSHDLLSHRNGAVIAILCMVMVLFAILQFGEIMAEWSQEKYAAVFNSFSDNIAGTSFRSRLCLPVPIDIVYTWVNGSDPRLINDLRIYKANMEDELAELGGNMKVGNVSLVCKFENCIPALGVVIDPAIPSEISLSQFVLLYSALREAHTMTAITDPITLRNVTVLLFDNESTVKSAINTYVVMHGQPATIRRLYYTSDWIIRNAVLSQDTLIVTGFPHTLSDAQLLENIPEKYRKSIAQLTVNKDKGLGILRFTEKPVFDAVLKDKNITINGKMLTFISANIVWDLQDYRHNEDISASRFEDNQELRYSLRSIEKFAPWIRHVFIVTNGQIPSWLNMDSSRLTVVTHAELFQNASHLPTFSSPAIESHLHRIPGLSDKFIYMNDDVMFGKAVWPDDFFTAAGGQKVYLTWPVPNCQDGCPSTWIRDGYCDKACNNSECEWDGGDCERAGTSAQQLYAGAGYNGAGAVGHWSASSTEYYCSVGCANNWIADRYCDQTCNVISCGFDAADCGIENFNQLHGVDLHLDLIRYSAEGYNVFYLNATSLTGESGKIEEGSYEQDPILRSVAIAQKFKLITVVLYNNYTDSSLNFSISGFSGKNSEKKDFQFNFTITVNTVSLHTAQSARKFEYATKSTQNNSKSVNKATDLEMDTFKFVPLSQRQLPEPKYVITNYSIDSSTINLTNYELPDNLLQEYHKVSAEYNIGDITKLGYQHQVFILWQRYQKWLHTENAEQRPSKKRNSERNIFSQTLARNRISDTRNANVVTLVHERHPDTDLNKNEMLYYLKKQEEKISKSKIAARTNSSGIKTKTTVAHSFNDANGTVEQENSKLIGNHKKLKNVPPETKLKIKFGQSEFESNHRVGRRLNMVHNGDDERTENNAPGFLPWEKLGVFAQLQRKIEEVKRRRAFTVESTPGRHLMDTFANSLRHVSRIYNRAYGYTSRKVPAHMPHMIDRHIVAEMQYKFPKEWDDTSAHRIRSSTDMQFGFSYFYYLMSEMKNVTIEEIFSELDVNANGVLSDREVRTLAARLNELPLDLKVLVGLEDLFINCSTNRTVEIREQTYPTEVYYETRMPQVTLQLIKSCRPITEMLQKQMSARPRYSYQTVGDDDVAFKMIRFNVSHVVGQLDDVRKNPKKFICLNDNIDYSQESARMVKSVLRDFYESVLPTRSQFELPKQYRNKFLHLDELRSWWYYRDWLKRSTQVAMVILISFTICSFVIDKTDCLSTFRRRWSRR